MQKQSVTLVVGLVFVLSLPLGQASTTTDSVLEADVLGVLEGTAANLLLPAETELGGLELIPESEASASAGAEATDRLANVVAALAQGVGITLDASGPLASSGLSVSHSAGIATVLESMLACQQLSAAVTPDALRIMAQGGPSEEVTWGPAMEACGEQTASDLDVLSGILDASAASSSLALSCGPIALWPVLYFEPCGVDNVHVWDYLLLIDVGGNDAYYNNAGGTIIDVMRGPAPALSQADSRGCETDQELNQGSGNCIPGGASALLDLRGDDVYQRLQSPNVDQRCVNETGLPAEPIVRRLATGGSGVAGVGLLFDERGDDTYLGKTLALGMGHSGGFGLLRDREGADSYSAIRSSAGAGVLVGLGVLDDQSGDDLYDPYNPAHGVIDNNGVCRAGNANLYGAGLIAAVGILRERSGDDTYQVTGVVNTLGSGDLAAVGIFRDGDGTDAYVGATTTPLRDNGQFFAQPVTPSTGGFEIFSDSG